LKKTILYKNGQTLSYTDYGSPIGRPILIQHGMIASIADQHLFARLIDNGARLISIARPGYGESSPYEMKNVAEWGDIVAALVDELGLAQLDVFGISSGAPYSYAIGARLPDRVRNIFILSGTPALFDDAVLSHWPYPVNKDARIADLQTVAYDLFFAHLSKEDRESNAIRDSLANACFGIALDLKIRCLDWGFPLSRVRAKVWMRHSRSDGNVPLITAELTARMLPNCQLEIRESDEHFSQEVLDDFIETVINESRLEY
jgi:pimeloyl-ACP methyl ester carboxylesterase